MRLKALFNFTRTLKMEELADDDREKGRENAKTMLKVVIAGESRAGKTALIHRYTEEEFSSTYSPTLTPEYCVQQTSVSNRKVLLQLWDLSGDDAVFDYLGSSFYRDVDCCMLVFDMTDKSSFLSLSKWLNIFLLQADPVNISKFPAVVVGTKSDLSKQRKVSRIEAESWCASSGVHTIYREASAKSKSAVNRVFESLAKHVVMSDVYVPLNDDACQTTKTATTNERLITEYNLLRQRHYNSSSEKSGQDNSCGDNNTPRSPTPHKRFGCCSIL